MTLQTEEQRLAEVGREFYSRWKQAGGAKPAWLENALRNGGARLADWEIGFYALYLAEHGDKQPKTPPLPHERPPAEKGMPDGKGKPAGKGKPGQPELPMGPPVDRQPPTPPLPMHAEPDLVLPDE